MSKFKNAVFLFNSLGFAGSLKLLLNMLPRLFGRFNENTTTIKTIIRSHKKIKQTINRSVIEDLTVLPASITKQAYTLYSKFSLKPNLLWHRFFITLNTVYSPAYISEDLFYTQIEPRLNQTTHTTSYSDKNGYNRLFPDIKQPGTILRFMNGSFFDQNYAPVSQNDALKMLLAENDPLLFKPSIDSGQGRNIFKLTNHQGSLMIDHSRAVTLNELEIIAPKGFIIQEIVSQHRDIAEIYPHSLNTIRIITLRIDGKIIILNAILKLGNSGHYLDKMAFGGLCCGIDNSGGLYSYAYDNRFKRHEAHPNTDVVFDGRTIPGFQKITRCISETHANIPYFDMISWDMAVSPDKEPVLIELNLRAQGIIYQQAIYGPLFGDHTEALFDELLQREKK